MFEEKERGKVGNALLYRKYRVDHGHTVPIMDMLNFNPMIGMIGYERQF